MNDATNPVPMPTPEDRALVLDTIARLNRAFDTEDLDALLDVFTDSGAWVSPLYGAITGREARATFFAEFFADDTQLAYRRGQHWVTNLIFEQVTDERIVTWSNYALYIANDGGPKPVLLGHYVDTFAKVGGRWLVERREIAVGLS